jgi:hypothetical protein
VIVEIVDLGTWGGASLVAEYDPCDDAIRVDARAVAAVRAALGGAEAELFTTVAIAHERFHRAHPHGTEAQAHAYAQAVCGVARERYERVLRLARGDAA